ncbi:nucleotide exchange factor GrpE [Corynebacterium lubricantis]|uniref:nucleotide exchange factor GrpE n=1 Tax=Corynebacterium lubricantis TaxID=541095 RepID=UPI000525EBED|nr:nucleotide exchange factor GrpE [Corynebacterium lubricantis]
MASNSMPNDPGNPENTDPENISPNQAEQEAQDAAEAQADARADAVEDAAAEGEGVPSDIDPELEAEIDEALAGVEAESQAESQDKSLEDELAERTEDLQRLSAEYANYRRRTERERSATIENAKASLVTQLLPLLDDLDLARQHGDLEDGPLKSFADKFNGVLDGQKVTSFGAEGDAFDPEIHEAVQDLSTGEEKVVGTVLRKGYRLGDRLVRNAMVLIADPAGPAEGSAQTDSEA